MTTATQSASTHTEIKQDVQDLANNIRAHIQITDEPNDPSRGLATVNDAVYVKNLPEGLDEAIVKKVKAYDSAFLAAGTLAFGEEGIDHLKKTNTHDRISLQIPTVGKDTMDFELRRSTTFPKPGATDGSTVTKHAAIIAAHNQYGTRNVGDLKKVKNHLAELGAKYLAGK